MARLRRSARDRPRRILVTGGAGYLGSVLVPKALAAGYRVRVLDRFFFGRAPLADCLDHRRLELVQDDIRFCPPATFADVDAVIHLAALSNDPSCDLDAGLTREINYEGTLRVAELARRAGVARFLFSSSCSMYGKSAAVDLKEDAPLAPVSLYARYKIEAERKLLAMSEAKFSVTSLRNPTLFGLSPRMRFDLVVNIMTQYAVRQGKIFITGTGQQWRPLLHVADCADAFLALLAARRGAVAGQAFNVGSRNYNLQVLGVAQIVKSVLPRTVIEIVPDDPDKRSYHVDFGRFRRVVGLRPKFSIQDGVAEIQRALELGEVMDDIRTVTVKYYKWLLDAHRIISEVQLRPGAVI